MADLHVAGHDRTWPLKAEQTWNSEIPVKAVIQVHWERSEASRKSWFGDMMKICLKWAETEAHGRGWVPSTRKERGGRYAGEGQNWGWR